MFGFNQTLKKFALGLSALITLAAPLAARQAASPAPAKPAAAAKAGKTGQSGRSTKKAPLAGKINLNSATVQDLTKLPRIGEKVAQRIVEYRTKHGGFKKPEELMNVKGIGEKTFDKMREHLSI
jgi:competence protein ComEA